jgi:hypothetical protein
MKASLLGPAGATVIEPTPATEGKLLVAVKVLRPAASRVADSAVVLTPLVKDTRVAG